jgi:ketosteroid isomerase-like protein
MVYIQARCGIGCSALLFLINMLSLKKIATMRKIFSLLLACFLFTMAFAQSTDEKAIRKVLYEQTLAWNKGDLIEFMKGYWNNDSLMFIGKNGVTYGYNFTLKNYQENYSTPDEMGTLLFNLLKVQRLSPEYYFVVGEWKLKRKAGDIGGHYNLLFRKFKGKWLIVADHSS